MMNANVKLLALAVIGMLVFVSCEKEKISYESQFEKSYRAWLNFKNVSGNSYRYEAAESSWTGASWRGVITVTDGRITQRYFQYKYEDRVIEEWTENENELGSHEPVWNILLLTMDEIYEKACSEWLIKRPDAQVFFETDSNGLISLCGYVEDNCADDCFQGIHIAGIESL
jgi:hypothetical protein